MNRRHAGGPALARRHAGLVAPPQRTSPPWLAGQLRRQPRSTAEVAAHLSVLSGAARVLVADLLDGGSATMRGTLDEDEDEDECVEERRELIEGVLGGLHAR